MKHVLSSLAVALVVSALAVAAGCGGGGKEAATSTATSSTTESTTTTAAPETTTVRVYFLSKGKVWPTARRVEGPQVASATLAELFRGPTAEERDQLHFDSAIAGGGPSLTLSDGVAQIQPQGSYTREALAQIVYTLTQFPAVKTVEIGGKRYTRADFEDLTPAILVESPLAFQTVGNPVRVTGTANTFEATFEYELTDTDGRIVDSHFVTATSGSGQRGTFDFTTKRYTVPFSGVGSLIVFERSAKDGARIHLVEIPLRMEK